MDLEGKAWTAGGNWFNDTISGKSFNRRNFSFHFKFFLIVQFSLVVFFSLSKNTNSQTPTGSMCDESDFPLFLNAQLGKVLVVEGWNSFKGRFDREGQVTKQGRA